MKKNYRKFFENAGEAMKFMASHNISPRPRNYKVWFEYISQSTPALNQAVQRLEREDAKLDEDATINLHNNFFSQGSAMDRAVLSTGEQLSEKLSTALDLIREAGNGTQDYGSTLDSISTDLVARSQKDLTGDSLQTIVDTLVTATTQMSEQNKILENQLEENTQEVEHLRQNLETTQREALTDQLTQLGNRKHFDNELAKAVLQASNYQEPMCLVMTDIDKFKVFNDKWGHQTGDQVLRLVAQCLANDVREEDISARYGGEEFGLILPGATLEEAAVIANKVRETVQSKKIMKRSTSQDLGTITISLGVAQYRPGEDIMTLIERADTCLYEAKEAGRNCVISETPEKTRQQA